MAKGARITATTGGYKDRPWIPRFWDGINLSGWFRLVMRYGVRVSWQKIPMAILMTVLSVINTCLWLIQALFYGRRIARTEIRHPPIFIIGHWRSGTTLLHEMLVLDSRHTFPNTYACFAPNHYLLTRRVLPPLLKYLLPERRPMDNMLAGWDRPQEDEFALCNMGLRSPYSSIAFPNEAPKDNDYLTLGNVPTTGRERWKAGFLWFLRCITAVDPKRIVLKSPPHTGRIKTLLEIFPDAVFVHIVRDPLALFPSTVNLWKRLSQDQGLQVPKGEGLEEYVFDSLTRMYEAFDRDRPLIPDSQFAEVRYEDLVEDPIGQMRRIYDELGLEGFEQVQPALEKFLASQSDYKRNRFEMAPELRKEISQRWCGYLTKYGYSDSLVQSRT